MNPLAAGVLGLFVIGVVVQTIGRMQGAPNVPVLFLVDVVAFHDGTVGNRVDGLKQRGVLQSAP